jgi:hypothetical protein
MDITSTEASNLPKELTHDASSATIRRPVAPRSVSFGEVEKSEAVVKRLKSCMLLLCCSVDVGLLLVKLLNCEGCRFSHGTVWWFGKWKEYVVRRHQTVTLSCKGLLIELSPART